MSRPGTCISPRWDGRWSLAWCFTPSGTNGMSAFRYATLVASAGLFVFYTVGLHAEVADWNVRARVSQKVVADLEREALATPEGSLLIVGAPVRSWEWALPFAARTALHSDRSRRTRVDRLTGADRLLPGTMDGAHATDHPGLVATGIRAAGGAQLGRWNRSVLEVDRSRGPCAPESGDGAARSRYVRGPGSSDVDDPATGPLTGSSRSFAFRSATLRAAIRADLQRTTIGGFRSRSEEPQKRDDVVDVLLRQQDVRIGYWETDIGSE